MTTTAHTTMKLSHFTHWLASGERGISSEAIVSHLTGQPVGRPWGGSDYPHDPDDFRRCQKLLNAVPLARLFLPQMATRSPQWARLVDAWDEIHAACEADCPGYLDRRSGSAKRAYVLMRRIIAGGTECTGCDGLGNGETCGKCKGTGRRGGGRCHACWGGHHPCTTCRGAGYTGGDGQ